MDRKIEPKYEVLEQTDNGVLVELDIEEDLEYFKGHFDDAPILAGIVQLDWAVKLSRRYFKVVGHVSSVNALKFKNLIVPGTKIQLRLQYKSQTSFEYSYFMGEKVFSSGRITLE